MGEQNGARRLRPYVFVCLAAMIAAQMAAFYLTRLLLPCLPVHDLSSSLDALVPFAPGWIAVYCLAYPFWLVSALWILAESRPHALRFACAYVLAMLLSAAVFLAYPCTMERADVSGGGFFTAWVRLVYAADAPTNLCPSLHVLINYFCWRGALGCRRIPRWYKRFAFVFLLLVCASVLLVKQHVAADIPAAVLIGEAALQAVRLGRPERLFPAGDRAGSGEKEDAV